MKKGNSRNGAKDKQKKKKTRKVVVLTMEILVLLLLVGVSYAMLKYGKLQRISFKDGDIQVNNGVKKEGYTTVALFGGDSREGALEAGTHADTIIIAAINNKTGEIRLASIYRDTLLRQTNESLKKANNAYFVGGPKGGINLLNRNLDLDIEDYVTVDFKAMADVVDLVGGITVDVSEEEADAMNLYLDETASVAGKQVQYMEGADTYKLDGVQAVTYARIRKLEGGDYKRTERQRTVINKMFEAVKKTNLKTLNKIIDKVFPQVSTSFTVSDLLGFAPGLPDYKMGTTTGFPFEKTDGVYDGVGSIVVPYGLAENVQELHKFLYPDKEYTTSETVQEISIEIEKYTGVSREDYKEEENNSSDEGAGTPSES